MATRITFLFALTTAPANRGDASPHSAGWSESFWSDLTVPIGASGVTALATKRAALLPEQGALIGIRAATYNILGNKIFPTGSSTAKRNLPGGVGRTCDLPQMGLEFSGTATAAVNASRFVCRGMPDAQFTNGEYQPTTDYKPLVTDFCNEVANQGWRFLGRDLSLPAIKVLSIAGNVVTLNAGLGAVVNTDYLRFRRVYDDSGDPVKGSYLIIANAGFAYTLAAFGARNLTNPSGTVRLDKLALLDFATVEPNRAVVRKVGRPSDSYRGRQSKR